MSEEQVLRTFSGDIYTPARPFENCVGCFWGLPATQPYIEARFVHVHWLLYINTREAAEQALEDLLDMLRLCRDHFKVLRGLVPALMLRLGQDQQCYDVIKWYCTTGSDHKYDQHDPKAGFLDVKGADAFEDTDDFCKHMDPNHLVVATLLKFRLLRDLRSLQYSSAVAKAVPQELMDAIRGELVGNVVAAKKDVMNRTDQTVDIDRLTKQVETLFKMTYARNEHFWSMLLNPGVEMELDPEREMTGRMVAELNPCCYMAEARLVLQNVYRAWLETPGAIDMVRRKCERSNRSR